MNLLKRLIGDSMLIAVLFSLLFLPFGAVGLSGVQQSDVLSETTVYEQDAYNSGADAPIKVQNNKIYVDENIDYVYSSQETQETTASSTSERE